MVDTSNLEKIFNIHKVKLDFLIARPKVLAIDGAINKNGIAFNDNTHLYTLVLASDKNLTNSLKLIDLANKLLLLLEEVKPDFVVIEGYSFGSIGRTFSISEVGGIFRYLSAKEGKVTLEIPPSVLKKYITTDGRADKKKMAKTVKDLFDLQFKTSDETDAFCLLVAAMDYFDTPLVKEHDSFQDYLMRSCKLLYGEHPLEIKIKNTKTKK